MFPCLHPCPPSARGLGQPSGQCHLCVAWALVCIYIYQLSVCLSIYLSLHTCDLCNCGGKERWTAYKVPEQQLLPALHASGTRCCRIESLIDYFSTGKNSSRSFTWERVALFRNYWFWVIFLSLWPFKKWKFWCLIFCATFMVIIKSLNIAIWGYITQMHSKFSFWYTTICCVAFSINPFNEYFSCICLPVFWEELACPKGSKSDVIALS